MAERRQIDLGVHHKFSGLDCRVTRKGLEIGGWYDSFVGIEGRFISWEEFDAARSRVMGTGPLECTHESWRGVDQTPLDDPEKKWRCDACFAPVAPGVKPMGRKGRNDG